MIFSKTYPSFLTLKEGSTFLTKPLFNSLYAPFGSPSSGGQKPSGTRGCNRPTVLNFLPLRLSCKESSTFSPSPSSSGSGDVTALRCSEPLRSKVGGASKPFAILCGMGPPYYKLLLVFAILCGMGPRGGTLKGKRVKQ